MSGNVLARYSKEHVLKAQHTFVHVGDLTKKPTIRDKIELLSSQKVGPKSKQLRVHMAQTYRTTIWNGEVLVSTCAITFIKIG
jgi:hypothetical protein